MNNLLNKDENRRFDIFELENILLYDYHWIPYNFSKLELNKRSEFYYTTKAYDDWAEN
jgi:hypothetical protein